MNEWIKYSRCRWNTVEKLSPFTRLFTKGWELYKTIHGTHWTGWRADNLVRWKRRGRMTLVRSQDTSRIAMPSSAHFYRRCVDPSNHGLRSVGNSKLWAADWTSLTLSVSLSLLVKKLLLLKIIRVTIRGASSYAISLRFDALTFRRVSK